MPVPLAETRKEEGGLLVDALVRADVEIFAAFWAFNEEIDDWRLNIISPMTDTKGPKWVIQQIHKNLPRNGKSSFGIFEVELFSPKDPSITEFAEFAEKWLPMIAGRGSDISGNKFDFVGTSTIETFMPGSLYSYSFDFKKIMEPIRNPMKLK